MVFYRSTNITRFPPCSCAGPPIPMGYGLTGVIDLIGPDGLLATNFTLLLVGCQG